MGLLRNKAMRDYQESVTTGGTDTQTDKQTPDKVIPMCCYASQKQLFLFSSLIESIKSVFWAGGLKQGQLGYRKKNILFFFWGGGSIRSL